MQVASLQALLVGGIEVDTPLGAEHRRGRGRRDQVPALSPNQRALAQAQFTEKIPFLIYFDGSVRGLNPGAPVEFRGITVGTVTSVGLEFDPTTGRIRIPVTIEIEPQRLIARRHPGRSWQRSDYRGDGRSSCSAGCGRSCRPATC